MRGMGWLLDRMEYTRGSFGTAGSTYLQVLEWSFSFYFEGYLNTEDDNMWLCTPHCVTVSVVRASVRITCFHPPHTFKFSELLDPESKTPISSLLVSLRAKLTCQVAVSRRVLIEHSLSGMNPPPYCFVTKMVNS